MHRMNPGQIQLLDSIDHLTDWAFVGKNPGGSIQIEHWDRQIFGNDWWLVRRLNKKIGWEQATGCFLHHHHRIPVMNVWGFEKSQFVLPEIKRLAIAKSTNPSIQTEPIGIELNR